MRKIFIFLFILLSFILDNINAQEKEQKFINSEEAKIEKQNTRSFVRDTLYSIELKDGNTITGSIISRDSIITIKTKSGILISIPRKEIKEITAAKLEYINGDYYIKDPNDARLFLAPTARPIRKNTGFLSDVELFFPMAGFGIENIVSVVGGVSIIPFSKSQLVYINGKVTPIQTKYMDLAAGYFYINAMSNTEGLSVGYFGGTFGGSQASLTVGTGISFSEKSERSPMFILGGEIRASKNVKFISENWIFTYKDAPVFMFGGLRVFGHEFAADFALMKIIDKHTSSSNGWPLIPYLSFTYNLNLN